MHPLDNVIWSALTTRQAYLAEASTLARRFPSDVTLLGAVEEPSAESYESLARLLSQESAGSSRKWTRPALVCLFFDKTPQLPEGWIIENSAAMLQMVREEAATLPSRNNNSSTQIAALGAADSAEMVALAQLTKPGPFGPRTYELGDYLGIRNGGATPSGELVAMAGERLRVPGYTEISAVCTHPNHLGRGYAGLLMTELVHRIHARSEKPFLHVRADNTRAIELYRRLGFSERVLWHYAVVRRASA